METLPITDNSSAQTATYCPLLEQMADQPTTVDALVSYFDIRFISVSDEKYWPLKIMRTKPTPFVESLKKEGISAVFEELKAHQIFYEISLKPQYQDKINLLLKDLHQLPEKQQHKIAQEFQKNFRNHPNHVIRSVFYTLTGKTYEPTQPRPKYGRIKQCPPEEINLPMPPLTPQFQKNHPCFWFAQWRPVLSTFTRLMESNFRVLSVLPDCFLNHFIEAITQTQIEPTPLCITNIPPQMNTLETEHTSAMPTQPNPISEFIRNKLRTAGKKHSAR